MIESVVGGIISGVVLHIIGEIFQRFFLSPVQEYKKVVGKVDNRLKYYANIFSNSLNHAAIAIEARKIIRELSCELEAAYKQIPFRDQVPPTIIPRKNGITKAARGLIYLSNVAGDSGNADAIEKQMKIIREQLRIPEL